ncbi:hydroxyisourate hydrolase [Rubinisphaera italica]|nr:hydroxyisourate hydrolase [Rubinisphaera italica]HBN74767.1 hypothetical protein [Planctomycetaceae bacterium]
MQFQTRILASLFVICQLGCGGTSSKPDYLSELTKLQGTVTVDGSPAAGVDVTFTPTEGSTKITRIAMGRTDENGVYTLYSPPGGAGVEMSDYPGVLPGVYKVTFSRFMLQDGTFWNSRTATEGPMNVGAEETVPAALVSPMTTPHEATVEFDDSQVYDFELTTKK